MSIVLFAIIGAGIKAGVGYWMCFATYCVIWLIKTIANFIEE